MSKARVNAKLKKLGLPIELVKGEGYFYFVYDDMIANIYETESIMVYTFNEYTVDQWVDEAIEFNKRVEENNG